MRVSLESILILGATLATAVFAIVAAMWVARKRRDDELRDHGNPLLVMPPLPVAPKPRTAPSAPPFAFSLPQENARELNDVVVPLSGPISAVEDPVTATTGRFEPGTLAAEVVAGHSLRFHRPSDGTLRFLPGFLEVVGGPDAGHEIRFVEPEPGESPEITFGRQEGPPYRHVQLLEPTVSRTHAKLSTEGTRWRLTNLSRTNPVVVNNTPLEGINASQLLSDDDLIEMGALVFRYHST